MSIDPIFWLLAAVGFLALEGMTFSMVSVWFAAGSAAALLCCLFTHSFRVQAVVFIAVSAVCLLAFKPLAKRLHKQPTPTNGDRALGRGGPGADPRFCPADGPGAAGWRGLERPLRHPRRYPDPRAGLPGHRDPQHPAHRGTHPDRIHAAKPATERLDRAALALK